eukprot:SAG31_NODE_4732_length_2994_cov_1.539710_1_plen_73_part_10
MSTTSICRCALNLQIMSSRLSVAFLSPLFNFFEMIVDPFGSRSMPDLYAAIASSKLRELKNTLPFSSSAFFVA